MKLNIQLFASGTINGSSTASSCDCRITWTSTGNSTTNSSSVTANVQIYRSGSSSTTGTFSGSLTINGTKYSISKKFSPYNWGSWATVGSKTVTIEHDADGTKTIPIKCSLTQTGTSMAGTYSASGNATLDNLDTHTPPRITNYTITETNSTLRSLGIGHELFVKDLSIKRFNIIYILYDDAQLDYASIINSGLRVPVRYSSDSLPIVIDFSQYSLNYTASKGVGIRVGIKDSKNGFDDYNKDTTFGYIDDFYSYVEYERPTITASVKRAGQTTGNVTITASGTYYKEKLGSENNGSYLKPKITYKYWEAGQDETQATTGSIPYNQITYGNGEYSTTYQVSNINYEKAYRFKIIVQDALVNNDGTTLSAVESNELNVATGKALWTEFKDRVDFAKLTINQQNVLVPYVLYDDAVGSTSTITLQNDSFANYQYVEIFYNYGGYGSAGHSSVKVYNPDDATFKLMNIFDNNNYLYINDEVVKTSGNQLTRVSGVRWRIATGGGNSTRTASVNNMMIYHIVGYK